MPKGYESKAYLCFQVLQLAERGVAVNRKQRVAVRNELNVQQTERVAAQLRLSAHDPLLWRVLWELVAEQLCHLLDLAASPFGQIHSTFLHIQNNN